MKISKKVLLDVEKAKLFAIKKGYIETPHSKEPTISKNMGKIVILLKMANNYCPHCKNYDSEVEVNIQKFPEDKNYCLNFGWSVKSGNSGCDDFGLRYFKTIIRNLVGEI